MVRHGYGPGRSIQTGIGALEVRRPEVRDRAEGVPGEKKVRFTSAIRRSLVVIRRRDGEVALDDFGTGFAGPLHPRDLPIDVLKLDKTFVGGIAENARDEAIVSSMIGLAHRLGLQVVAEGIETRKVAHKLRTIGCEHGQGFLISRPIEMEAAPTAVAAGAFGTGAV